MVPSGVLTSPWRTVFERLVGAAEARLLLCAPYVSDAGADAVKSSCRHASAIGPSSVVLTNLSPPAVCAGATDPAAIVAIHGLLPRSRIVHLPRLHAKVYCADGSRAIVTSGNLTHGGLTANYECGMLIEDAETAGLIEREMLAYAALGAEMDDATLAAYCQAATDARAAFRSQVASASRQATRKFASAVREAGDALLRARLAGGAVHTVFARTIEYLLQRHGRLGTEQMHLLIQGIHPDLCDDSVDRVINGQRFGKKWKHAVRTAQQGLKKKGLVLLRDGFWTLVG